MFEPVNSGLHDRTQWLSLATKIARPVLAALADGKLRVLMPVECQPGLEADRAQVTYLEALGRTLAGIAPWLELQGLQGKEETERCELAELARRAIACATDPDSPDFLNFSEQEQPLVDAAFLAQGLLRAPRELWEKLDGDVQARVIECLKMTRHVWPPPCNWLLFSGIIEALLLKMGAGGDKMRLDYAVVQHELWYKGDGIYGDGPEFHWDYYNSFVIQPMLLDSLRAAGEVCDDWKPYELNMIQRAQRFAAVQERLIAPDGSFPPVGRSLVYRSGAFQLLAQIALQKSLPPEILPSQVRCALTAMMRRLFDAPSTFDEAGWLRIAFCGHQPALGESYISTGSLYLCLTGFLPLGLSPADEFWSLPPRPWTAQRIYNGENLLPDHAIATGKLQPLEEMNGTGRAMRRVKTIRNLGKMILRKGR
jgi:hypothetical protein